MAVCEGRGAVRHSLVQEGVGYPLRVAPRPWALGLGYGHIVEGPLQAGVASHAPCIPSRTSSIASGEPPRAANKGNNGTTPVARSQVTIMLALLQGTRCTLLPLNTYPAERHWGRCAWGPLMDLPCRTAPLAKTACNRQGPIVGRFSPTWIVRLRARGTAHVVVCPTAFGGNVAIWPESNHGQP